MLVATLEGQLTGFDLTSAASTVEAAASMTTEEPLKALLNERAADLHAANTALERLVSGWDTPGWRRRSVLDPRPGASGSIEIVAVKPGQLSVTDDGATIDLPLSAWASHTGALANLFLGRLKRDWSPEEARGIAALLTLSATLETLNTLEPALGPTALRVDPSDSAIVTAPFDKAHEWAAESQKDLQAELKAILGDRTLTHMVAEQQSAARFLTDALIARDEGRWDASAERLQRLIKERRDSWLVMMLSKGPQ